MSLLSGLKPASDTTGNTELRVLSSSDNVSWVVPDGSIAELLQVNNGATVRLSDLLNYVLSYIAQNKMTVETNLKAQDAPTDRPDGIGIVFDSGSPMTH